MDVAAVGAPGGQKVTRSLLRVAKHDFILLLIICLPCTCVPTTSSSRELKRVNCWRLRVLNMWYAHAVAEHAKSGESPLCPGC